MDEWTPTTEDIRTSWYDDWFPSLSNAAFNRWLAAHDAEIRTAALEEAAEIAENRRPEIGPHILDTPYRSGRYDGGTRTAEAIRSAKDGAQ